MTPPVGEPAPPPFSEPSTPATGPVEDVGLSEFIGRIRRLEHRRGVEAAIRRRERRRRVATVAVGVVAALAVLLGASWLMLSGWQPPRPGRVTEPTSAPGETATPATPEPETKRDANGVTVPESSMTRKAGDLASTADEPQRPAPPPPEVGRQPRRTPSPRGEAVSRPARPLPRAPEATLPQGERPQPESASAQPLSARAGSDDREVAVDIAADPLGDGLTGYTVRLRERDGRPVTDATVSIRGRRADGVLVDATLDGAAEPGLYRAVVPLIGEIADLRLRVASAGRVQEVPLPHASH